MSVGSHASSGGIRAGRSRANRRSPSALPVRPHFRTREIATRAALAASAAGPARIGLHNAISVPRWIDASIPRNAPTERFGATRPAAAAAWARRAARAESNNRRGAQALHESALPRPQAARCIYSRSSGISRRDRGATRLPWRAHIAPRDGAAHFPEPECHLEKCLTPHKQCAARLLVPRLCRQCCKNVPLSSVWHTRCPAQWG